MATVSNFALRVPPSMMQELKERAEKDETSVNQLIVMAIAEKLAALRTREYFALRQARAVPGDFERLLAKAGGASVREGDEVPEGWLERTGADGADAAR